MATDGDAAFASENYESVLVGLRNEFVASMQTRAELVSSLAADLRRGGAPTSVLTQLVWKAHTLKGSAGTFGFPDIGEAAGEVERAALSGDHGTFLPDLDEAITFLFETIRLTADDRGASRADS